jgi:hypothetical protein
MNQPKVQIGNEQTLLETKENLQSLRAYTANYAWGSDLYTDFEKAYGTYLLVPFDIPKIVPNDTNKFVSFWFTRAANAVKIKTDMLSKDGVGSGRTSPYLQITSTSDKHSDVWSDNPVPEIYTEFPEIFEQVHEYMPFITRKDFKWYMWSSNWNVPAHRDYGSQLDCPSGIRIMLFDNNPEPTLSMTVSPIGKVYDRKYPIIVPDDTNSFAWNNLRQKHESVYNKGHRKVLFIISPKELTHFVSTTDSKRTLNKYIDLLDRSIAKYKDHVVVDTDNDYTDYLSLNKSDPINNVIPV